MRSLSYWLTVAFVFCVPWEAAIEVGAIGQLSKVVGLAAATAWAASVVARGRLRRRDAFQKVFFLFLIWNGLTFYWSVDSGATMSGFLTYAQIFVMLLILWDLLDTAAAIRPVLQAYVLGAFVSSGAIILSFLTTPDARFPERRFLALGFQVDAIALIIALALPAAWYLAASPDSWSRPSVLRLANYAYMPVGVFALLLTGTRGATLASIPTVLFVLWSLRRTSGVTGIAALATLVVAAVTVIWFAPREPLIRISSVRTATDLNEEGALSGRWAIWGESLQAFTDRPIAGAGLGAHRAVLDSAAATATGEVNKSRGSAVLVQGLDARRAAVATGREAHSAYLSVLVETGIVGLVLFAGVIVTVLARLRRLSGWQAWYWGAQLGVLAIGAISLSIEQRKDVWIFLALAVASAAAAEGPRPSFEAPAVPWKVPAQAGLRERG
jgi:hypothetical protein